MKALITGVVLIAIYAGALLIKNDQIEKSKSVYVPTVFDLQNKDGIPVYVSKVQQGKFQEFITLSGTLSSTGELKSAVAQSIKQKIRVGTAAYLDSDSGKRIKGQITGISAGPSLLTGLYEVTSVFPKYSKKSKVSVTIDVPVREVNNVILVPREGVNKRGNRPAAFILSNGLLTKMEVEIAGANSEEYWVKSGLKADQTVVVSDTRYFSGGEKVKVIEQSGEQL